MDWLDILQECFSTARVQNQEDAMKCLICHSEDIQVKAVQEEFDRGDDIVRVPFEIPVCANCGERYYSRQTMRKLEQLREQLDRQALPLEEVGKVFAGHPS